MGAFLALLAAGILLPSTARAGCQAHYLVSRATAGVELARLGLLDEAGALALGEYLPEGRPSPPPCSRGMCSGNPAAPVPAAPSMTLNSEGDWAILAHPPTILGQGAFHSRPIDPGLRPVDHSCSIFHPPRSRSSATSS